MKRLFLILYVLFFINIGCQKKLLALNNLIKEESISLINQFIEIGLINFYDIKQ